MLASMCSQPIVAPIMPDVIGICIAALPVLDHVAPALHVIRFEPARGPPALAFFA